MWSFFFLLLDKAALCVVSLSRRPAGGGDSCHSAFRVNSLGMEAEAEQTGPRPIPKENGSSSRFFKDFKKYQQQTESLKWF